MSYMTAYVFDIDGVICDRGCNMNEDFKSWFKDWACEKSIYFLTGSNREKNIRQVGQDVLDLAKISFHCLGNSIWENEQETLRNQFVLNDSEIDYLNDVVYKSAFAKKSKFNNIEHRKGSVNFTIIDRNASIEERKAYIFYDNFFKERETIIEDFKKRFDRLDIFLGGDVSLDICLLGADKSQCFSLIKEENIHFFGDRCYRHGIDEPFAKKCVNNHKLSQIEGGYQETWKILKSL